MKKRYLPFGYAVRDGNIVVDTEQGTIVQTFSQRTLQEIRSSKSLSL